MPGCGVAVDDAIHGDTNTEPALPPHICARAVRLCAAQSCCCIERLTLFDILAVISDFLQSLSPLLNQVYYCQVLLAFCLDLIVYFLPSSGPHFSMF